MLAIDGQTRRAGQQQQQQQQQQQLLTPARIDVAQFYHVNFMRGQEQRLAAIKRKVSVINFPPKLIPI